MTTKKPSNTTKLIALNTDTNAEYEFFHRERFRDIVVCSDFEAVQYVSLQCFCREEDDRYLGVQLPDFTSQCKAVFFRHHNVKHADVVFVFHEGAEA